jgi:hypothetical protein
MTAYSLPDLLRGTAGLIRVEHGPACPDRNQWADTADLIEQSADRVDAGLQVCTKAARAAAVAYLTFTTPELEPHR